MSFVPIFWNTETQQNLENKTSKIYGSHIAYKKQGYDWTSVSNDVQTDLSVSAFAGNVQFPTTAQGWMDICFNSEYSAKRQITEGNWSNTEDEFNMRMRTDTPTNSVGIIHPDKPWQVIYYNAFGQGANLIYGVWRGKQCRVEHVIEITEMPAGDSEYLTYDFFIESADATAFIGDNYDQRPWAGSVGDSAIINGFSVFIAKGDDFNTPRGSVLRTPVCWWYNLDGTTTKKDVKIDFEIQPDGITVKATKYVKRSDIADALAQGSVYRADATFTPDANPETTSVDGMAARISQTESWSDLITGVGNYGGSNATQEVFGVTSHSVTDEFTQNWCIFLLFDTSAIGTGQEVGFATLTMKYDRSSDSDMDISSNIYSSNPASNTNIVAADYMLLGSTPFSTARDLYAETDGSTEVVRTLNSDGRSAVSVTGITKLGLGLVQAHEAGGGTPTWAYPASSRLMVRLSEYSGTADDPLLTVTHSSGPTQLVLRDRVKETTTSTGTGTINLAGAVTGFQDFVSAIDDNNECYYTILDANGTDWEIGVGVVTDSATDTLSRPTVLQSSNSDNTVDLSVGTHTVFLTYPADKSVYRNTNDQIVATASGIIFSDDTVQTTAASASVTYTAGTGLLLSGTEFNVSGVDTSLLQGTVANNQLANSSVTITAGTGLSNGGSVSLGGSVSIDVDSSVMQTGDNVSLLTNDAGYLTAYSETGTLQTVTDNGSTTSNAITINDNLTAEKVFADLDGPIVLECKNTTGSQINAGTPVYVSGYFSGNGKALISPAIGNNSSKMPAIGLLESNLSDDTEGNVHIFGLATGFDTSSFSVGETIYVAATGGLTNTRPTGVSDLVQNMGRVLRSDASQGRVLLLGPGRSNDVPNSGNFTELTVDNVSVLTAHPSISAASSVDNSARTYIQDLTLDSNGHVTAIVSAAETVTDTNTTYTAGTGLLLSGTEFDVSGVDTSLLQGTISTAQIGDDQVTVDKLADSINTAIDANTAKVTTDTASVTAAGALMDSEVDADIKTLVLPASTTISSWGASLIDDTTAANARTTLGLQIGVDIQNHSSVLDLTTASYTTTLDTKLDNIEENATADQTQADINALEITKVGTIATGVWQGTAIAHAYIGADAIDGDNIGDNVIDSEHYAAGSIDLEHMSSESVDEDNLHISNVGSNGEFLSKQSGDNGGLTWATPTDTNTTYTAGTGITLNGTEFDIDPTLISGRTEITSADADYLLVWDADDSKLKKVDAGEFRGGGGGGDITSVVAGSGLSGGGTTGDVTVNVSGVDTSLLQGTISSAQIANDAIDSQHYTDASIDNAHLADDAVGIAELSATGTASESKYLAGNNSWKTASFGLTASNGGTASLLPGSIPLYGTANEVTVLFNGSTGFVWGLPDDVTITGDLSVGTIASGVWQGTAIAHAYIGADAIDGDNIADDSVDSEHYVDGSIDTAHIGDDQVTAAKVAADVATQAELDTVSTVANAALPKTGGAMTGAITTNSTFDGVDIATRDAVLTSTTTTANAALPKAGGTMTGTLTVGVDGTGKDVKLYGDTAGSYLEWDESEDRLNLVGGAYVNEAVPANDTPTASSARTLTFDLSTGNYQNQSLPSNSTVGTVNKIIFSNAKRGQRFIIRLTQHASSANTVSWADVDYNASNGGAAVRWAGNITPTMSTSTSHTDVYGFLCTNNAGTTFDGFIIGQDIPD